MVWRAIMRQWSRRGSPAVSLPKQELFNESLNTGMIVQVDHWLDTHLPADANSAGAFPSFTARQIAASEAKSSLLELLLAVVAMRADASGDRLKNVSGERID